MKKTGLLMIVKILFALNTQAQNNVACENVLGFSKLDTVKVINNSLSMNVLPANFYASHLPFFCDKELKIQKVTRVPVKFRLGSVAYTDKMEQKNSAITGLH